MGDATQPRKLECMELASGFAHAQSSRDDGCRTRIAPRPLNEYGVLAPEGLRLLHGAESRPVAVVLRIAINRLEDRLTWIWYEI